MRKAELSRKTNETDIIVSMNLDGEGKYDVQTDVPFLNHMLELFSKHSLIDLTVKAKGDVEIDGHHTVEDIGIVMGQVFLNALGDKKSIRRYGFFVLPMDEVLSLVALDISNRPYLVYDVPVEKLKVGTFDSELIKEFFQAFAFNAKINLHIKSFYGDNVHHVFESVFKAFARALRDAVTLDDKIKGIPTTKGML